MTGVLSEIEVGPSTNSVGPQAPRSGVHRVLVLKAILEHLPSPPPSCPQSSHPSHRQDQSSLGSWFQMPAATYVCEDHFSEKSLWTAGNSKDSPLKPEVITFWAQGNCFSCPTCFRTDRFCTAQGKKRNRIALGASLGLSLCQASAWKLSVQLLQLFICPPCLWATQDLPSIRSLKLEVATFLGCPSCPQYPESHVIWVAICKKRDTGCWHD